MISFLNLDGRPVRTFARDRNPPSLGRPRPGIHEANGYRVVTRELVFNGDHPIGFLEYGKPRAALTDTISRVRLCTSLVYLAPSGNTAGVSATLR